MGTLIDLFMPKNKGARKIKFDMAIQSSNQIANLFKLYREGDFETALDQNAFTLIYPHDPKSPAIHWVNKSQYIIKYPSHSRPYSHKFTDKCKFIEVLSGKLFDKNSNTKLFQGDKLKVSPSDNYEPFTLDDSCYLRVCIGNCESLFEQVCC